MVVAAGVRDTMAPTEDAVMTERSDCALRMPPWEKAAERLGLLIFCWSLQLFVLMLCLSRNALPGSSCPLWLFAWFAGGFSE